MVSRPLSPRVVVSNLPRRLSSWALAALAVGFTGAMVGRFGSAGDYPMDAERSVNALSHGHLHDALTHQPLMGPLSIVLRAPFVTLARFAGAGEPGAYKTGAVVCVVFAAALGVSLALSRLDSSLAQAAVLVVVTVLNPASIAAVQYGHPEEVLAAALSVGAVALALRDRELSAAVALGLAIASKQWAILAVAPTLLALPSGKRLRLLCISGLIAAGATLPLLAADPAGFGNVSRRRRQRRRARDALDLVVLRRRTGQGAPPPPGRLSDGLHALSPAVVARPGDPPADRRPRGPALDPRLLAQPHAGRPHCR